MCFGPCGMIKHLKCSDEIDKHGLKAMESNRGLKYMCHGCRKDQISYNNVLEKCREIFHKMDEIVNAFKEEVQQKMVQMQENFCEKLKCELNDVVVQIKRSEESKMGVMENLIKKCFENVTDNKSPEVTRRNLRSRKRARTDEIDAQSGNQSKIPQLETPTNATFADVLKNAPKCAKPKQDRRSVIIVKPKEIVQTTKKTKEELRAKVDRAANSINVVHEGNDGTIILGVDSAVQIDEVVKSMQEKIGEKYEVRVPAPKKPRLKIVGVEDQLSETELKECLAEQNMYLKKIDLKLVTCYSTERLEGSKTYSYIVEVDSNAHQLMLEAGRVNIGWERCKVLESFNIMRCFKCCGYGHKSATCKSDEICGKCTGLHKSKQCASEEIRCINCVQVNKNRKLNLDTNHYAFSQECPTYKKLVARKRQEIEEEA